MSRGSYIRDFYFIPTILYHNGDDIYYSLEFAWLKWYIGFCWHNKNAIKHLSKLRKMEITNEI